MAYSDLNYASPKTVKAVFGLTDAKFTMLAVEGRFRFKRAYKNPLVYMSSLAAMYEDRDNIVLKKWGYDYELPKDKYEKMLTGVLKGLPRCFFRVKNVPDGYYRVFYRGDAFKLCIFVYDGFMRCVCFDRSREHQLEQLYFAYEEGKVDIED